MSRVLPRLAFALALLAPAALPAAAQSKLAVRESKGTVEETVVRLTKAVEDKGIKIAGRVDHAAGAQAAGLQLPPTVVVMFGSPKLGTPLIQANPQIGIDLPMRMLVWQDKAGKVWVGYTPPATLQARHGIDGAANVEALKAMAVVLDSFAKAAAGN